MDQNVFYFSGGGKGQIIVPCFCVHCILGAFGLLKHFYSSYHALRGFYFC